MEKGFYNPEIGYWQTVGGNPSAVDYAAGTIEVPLKPSADYSWLNGEWVFIECNPPTPEQIRKDMPKLSMVDFRRKLRGIKVIQRLDEDGNADAELDGIYEADILEKIDLIADKEIAAEARDYFLYAQYIERINPWVEILGSIFDITPEEIDTFWMA